MAAKSNKTAAELKTEENEHFKTRRHAQAAILFAKNLWIQLIPFYPSNLSAALYETGQYTDSIRALLRSWSLLKRSTNAPDLAFATRLFTRLGKALAQGISGGSVDLNFVQEHQLGIERLKSGMVKLLLDREKAVKERKDADDGVQIQEKDEQLVEALKECLRAWPDLMELTTKVEGRSEVVKEWLGRLSYISVLKKPATTGMNYWGMGMDTPTSILRGFEKYEAPQNLSTLPTSRLSKLSFLFAGVGDGRHVYSTLIDLHFSWQKLSKEKRDATFVHVTMLDIHPAMLARDMILLMLVSKLGDEGLEESDRLEIQATAVYLWNGIALPSCSDERVRTVMQDLRDRLTESPPRLRKWLVVAPDSLPGIIRHIMWWLTLRPVLVDEVLDSHEYKSMDAKLYESLNDPMVPPDMRAMALERFGDRRKDVAKWLKSQTIQDLREIGLIAPDETDAYARKLMRSVEWNDRFIDLFLDISVQGGPEDVWYTKMKVYLPPPQLRSRHPYFEELAEGPKAGKNFDSKLVKQAEKQIRASWQTNRTFWARDAGHKRWEQGYTDETSLSMSSLEALYDTINSILPKGYPKNPHGNDHYYFDMTMTYFDLLGKAIKGLEGHLRVESLAGNMITEMAKIWHGGASTRPAEWPTKFTRGWLSNVPDCVGGILSTAIYLVPSLDGSPESAIGCNTLAATGLFRVTPNNHNEFCHNYTLLPFKDLPRYLGCKVINEKTIFGSLVMTSHPFPRPLDQLASRVELTTWLTRHLVNIMVPGRSEPAPNYIFQPSNLAAFLNMLVHLHRVGFPGHWLADFLQIVLSGSMVTDIEPWDDKWPILLKDMKHRTKMRRIRFDPWLADFENILAVCHEGLPFSITLPPDFARTPEELGTYSAKVSIQNPLIAAAFHERDPNIVFVFYKKQPGMSEHWILARINDILGNKPWSPPTYKCPPPGDIVILTATESFDRVGEAVWKRNREKAEEMMNSGGQWVMVASRSSTFNAPETSAVSSSKWRVVS